MENIEVMLRGKAVFLEINLFQNTAESNLVNKAPYLTSVGTLRGALRQSADVLTPSLIIARESIDFNYVYIHIWNRYYYVMDFVSLKQGLWQINLKIDVLMSFDLEIRNQSAVLARQEYHYNPEIEDKEYFAEYANEITEEVPEGASLTAFTPALESSLNTIVGILTTRVTATSYADFINTDGLDNVNFNNAGRSPKVVYYVVTHATLERLLEKCVTDSSLASFVVSIVQFPFELDVENQLTEFENGSVIYYGNDVRLECEEHTIKVLTRPLLHYIKAGSVKLYRYFGSFLDFSPYSKYEFYLPYSAYQELDGEQILNDVHGDQSVRSIDFLYYPDISTGRAQIVIRLKKSLGGVNSYETLYTGSAQIGYKIPVNSTNAYEIAQTSNANTLNMAMGIVASSVGLIVSTATANPLGMVGSVVGMVSATASYTAKQMSLIPKAYVSVNSDPTALATESNIRLKITRPKLVNYGAEFSSLYGKPSNEYTSLGGITGYTQVGQIHLTGFGNATRSELDEIESLLKSGVIL